MREIKFRAWDGLNLRYGYIVKRNQDGHERTYIYDAWADETEINEYAFANDGKIDLKDCFIPVFEDTVSQSTGLLDKNGKLIFEGDIVRHQKEVVDPWRNDNSKDYTVDDVYEIKFLLGNRDDGFRACKKSSYEGLGEYTTWIEPKHMEVIGNKYENPELTKDSEAKAEK